MIEHYVGTMVEVETTSTESSRLLGNLKESFEETLSIAIENLRPTADDTIAIPAVIFPDHVELEVDNGFKKRISFEDFKKIVLEAMGNNEEEEEEDLIGVVPPANTVFFAKSKLSVKIMCYYPGGIRILKYAPENREVQEFPIVVPNILISHTLNKDNSSEDYIVNGYSKYFCTPLSASQLPTRFIENRDLDARIYMLPMTNIYEGSNMCFGNNVMPVRFKNHNYRGLDYYHKFMWETPFNQDLGVKALDRYCAFNHPTTWYKYLSYIAKRPNPEFPYFELSGYRDEAGKTVGPNRSELSEQQILEGLHIRTSNTAGIN